MLTSLVASILVVVLLLVPLPPWIPHSTRLSFNKDHCGGRMFRRHLGVGGGETGDEVGGEAPVDNLHNHNQVFCQRKRKAEDDIWGLMIMAKW